MPSEDTRQAPAGATEERVAVAREPRPDVDPKYLDPDGPPHPDLDTERRIIRWALEYYAGEPSLFGEAS